MITVIKSGLFDTVQDLGRYGYQRFGVVAGGVMDPFSHRVANLLVGNEEDAATIEMSLVGPVLLFEEDTVIAICGGDLTPMIAGILVPMWKPVFIRKGSELRFGAAKRGSRAYLAVAGGLNVPVVLGSRSTYVKAKFGGMDGRVLREDDVLRFNSASGLAEVMKDKFASNRPFSAADWQVTPKLLLDLSGNYEICVMPCRQYELFNEDCQHQFWNETFTVSSQSDPDGLSY